MKQKLLKIATVVIMIITLTLANFLLLCVDVVSYAIDVNSGDSSTNHKNIEFMAYFKDEKGEKVTSLNIPINKNDLKLYFHISVKKEGYFNGSINLENSNFKFDKESLNSDISYVDENTITLNQINAGDIKDIEIDIDVIKNDIYDLKLINFVNEISINGIYKDSTEKDIKIKSIKNVELILNNPYNDNNAILTQSVITNKVLSYKGEKKRIVQIQVNSGVDGNLFPIKTSSLKITTPKILNKYPEKVLVNSIDILTSTGNRVSDSDYNYNKEDGIVNIDLQNVLLEDNKVNWIKTGEDVITLTYIYEADEETEKIENLSEQSSNIDLSISFYDLNNTIIKVSNSMEIDNEEKDSIITSNVVQNENSIYKGKLYSEISRDIEFSTFINVNLTDVSEFINIIENRETIEGDNFSYNFNSVYKKTLIKKTDLEEIFGQDGYINILNAENKRLISTIRIDSEVDENGYINIIYPNDVTQIEIETSKPETVGKIEIKHVKTIKNINNYLLAGASKLKYSVNGKYIVNNEDTEMNEIFSDIELKETETSAKLEISKENLSAMTINQNVEFRVILESKNENNELYKNPIIKLELPDKFENIDVKSINLLYEDELQIASTVLKGNTIEIILKGEQTKYKEEAIEGAVLIINADLTTSKKVASSTEQIILTYSNENVRNYKENAVIGQEEKHINIISYAGLITINKINGYDVEVINNEGNRNAKLAINTDTTTTKIENEIINNVGNTINNVNILGIFPTEEAVKGVNNIETKIIEAIAVQGIDTSRVKVYYSNNADATTDLNNKLNLWTENIEDAKNVKKYLIVIDKLEVYEQINLSYVTEIPENLEYNAIAELGYEIYYINNETNITEQIKLHNLSLGTGKGPIVDTTLKAYVGNKEANKVREGEIVTYSITVANTGTEEAHNIEIFGKVPENTVFVKENQMEYEMSNEDLDFIPFTTYEDIQDVKFDLESLAVGESVTKTYQVKVNDKTQGQTISNELTTTYGEVTKNSNEIISDIESGNIRLELYAADDASGVLENTYLYRYVVNVENVSDKDKKDVRFNVDADDIIDIQEIFYMTPENEYVSEKENKYIEIKSLKAGEKVEVCIVVKSKTIANGDVQNGKLSANIVDNNVSYYSNVEEVTVKPINLQTSIYSENSDSYVKGGDTIEYIVSLKNNAKTNLANIVIANTLSDKTTLLEITKNGDVLDEGNYSQEVEFENDSDVIKISSKLNANEQAEYKVKAVVNKVPGNVSSIEIANSISVLSEGVNVVTSEIKHILEPEYTETDDFDNDNNNNDNTNNGDEDNSQNNGNDQNNDNNNSDNINDSNNGNGSGNIENVEKVKSISGTAWIDENENGSKDSNEKALNDITVRLLDTKTNTFVKDVNDKEILVKTNDKGFYSFDSVKNGEYIVVFEYDTTKYILTSYLKDGVNSKNTSKVINKVMPISGVDKTVGVTGIIKVDNNNISNVNIGLQNAKNFDLKLDKYISKVVIQNSKGTTTRNYTNTTFAKEEIDSKLMNGTTAIVEYTIKVTNIGDTDAYVKKIADYISKDYKFTSELNKDWYQSGSTLYNSSLANSKLKAGESKEIKLIVTKQMTENNTGLVNNTAEIVESYNELGLKENKTNNKGSADLILSIKTGQIATTIILILLIIAIIGAVSYIGGKYVIKRRGRI